MHVFRRRWDYYIKRQPTPYFGAVSAPNVRQVLWRRNNLLFTFRNQWNYYRKRQVIPHFGITYASTIKQVTWIRNRLPYSIKYQWNYYSRRQPIPNFGVGNPPTGAPDRILTQGLKTGTGVGGVEYILRRGLISAVFVPLLRRDMMAIEREGNGVAVTPSDTVDLAKPSILYIGGAGSGNLKVDLVHSGTVVFVGIPANTWIDRVRVKRVWDTGTDVTSILAFY